MAVTLIDSVFSIQLYILTVALPLWIVRQTSAPRWMISTVVVVNTIIVVTFQVRASKDIKTLRAGGAAFRRAGFALLASMAVISVTNHVPEFISIILLTAAIAIQTVGELWYSAGVFELSFGLAPAHAQGQYLGVFGMGAGLAGSVGPALLIGLCIDLGSPGWWITGALFAGAGLAAPPVVRWAERSRNAEVPTGNPGANRLIPPAGVPI
jgi:hypothetical protein